MITQHDKTIEAAAASHYAAREALVRASDPDEIAKLTAALVSCEATVAVTYQEWIQATFARKLLRFRRLDSHDAIQECTMSLLLMLRKYDHARFPKFMPGANYYTRCWLANMRMRYDGKFCCRSTDAIATQSQYHRAVASFVAAHGTGPANLAILAAYSGVSARTLLRGMRIADLMTGDTGTVESLPASDDDPVDAACCREEQDAVRDALRQLNPEMRALVHRYYGIDEPAMTYASIAAARGVSHQAIAQRMHRAKTLLQRLLIAVKPTTTKDVA